MRLMAVERPSRRQGRRRTFSDAIPSSERDLDYCPLAKKGSYIPEYTTADLAELRPRNP